MNDAELNALLKLLSDSDDFVSETARQKLLDDFDNIHDKFNTAVDLSDNEDFIERANDIYIEYNYLKTKKDLKKWVNCADKDFLKGIYILNRFFSPGIELRSIINFIDNFKRKFHFDVKNLSPIEQVRLLNFAIFKDARIKVIFDKETINNSLITNILNNKKATPTLITIFYFLLAKKLDIPFENTATAQKFYFQNKISYNFFVNVPDRGYIYTNDEIKFVLEKFKIKTIDDFMIMTPSYLLKILINKFMVLAKAEKSFYYEYLLEIQGVVE